MNKFIPTTKTSKKKEERGGGAPLDSDFMKYNNRGKRGGLEL